MAWHRRLTKQSVRSRRHRKCWRNGVWGVWRECSSAFVAEDQHFANVVQGLEEPLETGEDGKAILEIIFAAYESAGTGRKVALPFVPPEGKRPVELWR